MTAQESIACTWPTWGWESAEGEGQACSQRVEGGQVRRQDTGRALSWFQELWVWQMVKVES